MSEREITVHTADGEMTAFIVHPDVDGPYPIALLFMDGIGYREQIRANARRFASAGYYCAAPDLYYRLGKGVTFDMRKLGDAAERDKMMAAVKSATPELMLSDAKALLDVLKEDPFARTGNIVCVGYCMGARCSLHVASTMPDRVVAAACIHPGALINDEPTSPHHDLSSVRGELYVSFAEQDQSATPENVELFRAELERLNVRGTVERVTGAAHGFAMEDLPVYNHDAAERHFTKTIELWQRNLQPQAV